MISACIVSAAWRRFDVTRLVLRQRERLCADLASRGIQASMLVVADDENLEIAREHGAATIEAPNEPLGRKCNAALRYAADRADWVVWVGSDDWIHPDVFDPLLDARDRPATIITGQRIAIVDLATGRLRRITSPSRHGAIPWLIDSRLLRVSRGPIRPDLPRGLDGGLIRGIRLSQTPFTFERHDPHEFRCVDFKSDVSLSPFNPLAANLGIGEPEHAWETLATWFPADLVDQARELVEKQEESRC